MDCRPRSVRRVHGPCLVGDLLGVAFTVGARLPSSDVSVPRGGGLCVAGCGGVEAVKQDGAVKPPDAVAVVDSAGSNAPTCATTPANLAGRWRGDGNTNDDSGNAYNGAAVGTLSYTTGKHGMAFLLDGSTNLVSINDGDALWPAASLSVEAWVKTTSSTNTAELVMKYQCAGSCPTNNSFALYALRVGSGGHPIWDIRADGSSTTSSITDTGHNIADGNWHYLVGVRDVPASQSVLYLDGAVAGTLTLPSANLGPMTNLDSETDNVTLGAGTTGGTSTNDDKLAGALDEVAIYKSAMTAAQVAAIYAAPDGECH